MKTKAILRTFFTVVMLCLSTVLFAQAKADKLFLEGQNLQKVMTVKSQNAAINKFKAAKINYNTDEKKQMCDNQIAICNQNISSIRNGGGNPGRVGKTNGSTPEPASSTQFSLTPSSLTFDGDRSGTASVAVTAPTTDWNFTSEAGINGSESFATIKRSRDAKSLSVETFPNPTTLRRQQTVSINYKGKAQTLTIRQEGKTVTLSTSKNNVDFKAKGGTKTIELYTNSDSVITTNNNLTWYVESKPDWVEVNGDVQKRKGFIGSVIKAGKDAIAGTATDAEKADTKTFDVKIQVMGIAKNSPEYQTGRKGEVVFAAQDIRYKVTIIQQ
jgi:hypothetical protein